MGRGRSGAGRVNASRAGRSSLHDPPQVESFNHNGTTYNPPPDYGRA